MKYATDSRCIVSSVRDVGLRRFLKFLQQTLKSYNKICVKNLTIGANRTLKITA